MDYWKLGCDYWGKGRFVFYDLLKAESIVICKECDVQVGDAVAISFGYNVKAIAIIINQWQPVTNLPHLESLFHKYEIGYNSWVYVANCKFIELPINERFNYHVSQGISKIQNKSVIERIQRIISEYKSNTVFVNKAIEMYQPYINLLRSTHNLILTGAPGTGKTYLARQIAEAMGAEVGFVQFHPSYDYTDFVEGLRPIQDDNGNVGFERKDGVFKEFCAKALEKFDTNNFDDAWSSFLNEVVENGNLMELKTPSNAVFYVSVNQRKNLTFYTGTEKKVGGSLTRKGVKTEFEGNPFYKYWLGYYNGVIDYLKNKHNLHNVTKIKPRDYVFIIDEINRGEISKIFGELFFSIDPGYRGEKGRVQTQYQNIVEDGDIFKKGFFVPENVYIIGTMNDIDRSVESMDFAFRRRFAFKEIKADENVGMLENLTQKVEAINRMKKLNSAIEKVDGLSSAYHIGASYFLKLNDYNGDFDKLWEYHLEGLLREYLRGTQDVDKEIEKLKTAYNDESDHNNGQPQQAH